MKPKTAHDLGQLAKALDAIADKVLAHRPKPKSAPAKRRKRRKTKLAKKPR